AVVVRGARAAPPALRAVGPGGRGVSDDVVAWVDQRTGAAKPVKRVLRYVFPDHWSFLLGEVALYSFVVLVATGIYIALFFEPNLAKTTYDGVYEPLRGMEM